MKGKIPYVLKKEELIRLFEAMYRPKCSIACFVGLVCGLRIREVCKLEVADIDLERRTIKIKDSKNPNRKKQGYGKDRFVPIPMVAISPLRKWLSIIEGSKYFLPSERSPDLNLRTKTLHEWFYEARKRANLDKINYKVQGKKKHTIFDIKFHSLRHFYATYLYEKTRDLYAVAKALGHNQVTTTQVYATVSDKIMQESVDFAFSLPVKTRVFSENPSNNLNYNIPDIAKKEKTPIEILEDRLAKGEISESEFHTKLRLLKLSKEYIKENEINKPEEAEHN